MYAKKSKYYVITWRTSDGEDIKTQRNDDAGCISLPSSRGSLGLPLSLSLKMNPSEAVTATSMYGIICWRVGGLDTCMETQMLRSVACPGSIYMFTGMTRRRMGHERPQQKKRWAIPALFSPLWVSECGTIQERHSDQLG